MCFIYPDLLNNKFYIVHAILLQYLHISINMYI